jgi:membrane protein DedA with SNARE-associated domain
MEDPAAAYGLGGKPFWLVVLALFVIVLVRSHATFWLGRAVAAGAQLETERRVGPRWWLALLDRIDGWSRTPRAARGLTTVHRWGPLAIAPAYVVVGLQTAVLLAAGLLRMPYARFVPASLVGAGAWALVWSTVGMGAVWAAVALAARSGWVLAAVVVGLLAAVTALAVRRRRGGRATAVLD